VLARPNYLWLGMEITYYGHSCFGIAFGKTSLLIDPFIRPNPAAAHIAVDALEPTHILLTHGHADHVADAEEISLRCGAPIVAGFEVCNWFGALGVEQLMPLNHGGVVGLGGGDFRVRSVAAVHSSTMPDGAAGGDAMGFVIESGGGARIYCAGDTALTMEMELIGRHWPVDLAILPIGDCYTMGVADACIAAKMVSCNQIIGCHYDTFPPIEIDRDAATAQFAASGCVLDLLEIGQSISIN
jgi:L-ascorbate metabolism protein UlaG (beta-lactamase superfamily)